MEQKRPDITGVALLQGLVVLRDAEQKQIQALERDRDLDSPVHPYAWGLFKTTLLKATKDRQDLKDWSPELFKDHITCPKCNGEGRTECSKTDPNYLEQVADGDIKDGDELFYFCSPCQGSGIWTAYDIKFKEKFK